MFKQSRTVQEIAARLLHGRATRGRRATSIPSRRRDVFSSGVNLLSSSGLKPFRGFEATSTVGRTGRQSNDSFGNLLARPAQPFPVRLRAHPVRGFCATHVTANRFGPEKRRMRLSVKMAAMTGVVPFKTIDTKDE
jgi:hypothetical protein